MMNGNNAQDRKFPTIREGISDSIEIRHILYAMSKFFPMVIWVNLTRNVYTIMEYEKFATRKAQITGCFDELIEVGAGTVDPAHRQMFIEAFSRENLLQAYARGETSVVREVRQLRDDGEYGWVRTTVIFLTNDENNEVIEITFAQPIEEEKAEELDNQRLRALLEMSLLANYEYISLINTRTGLYETYANDGYDTHKVPMKGDYDKTLMFIRDTLVPEEERQEYFANGKLSNVIGCMAKHGGHYKFRYRLNDTEEQRWREVMYYFCTPDKEELLMTVRDIHDEVTAEQSRWAEEALIRGRERQQLLTWLGFDIILDIDVKTSFAELLGDESFLQREIICEDFPMGEIRAGMVHADDVCALQSALDYSRPDNIFQVDFRYKRGDGKFFWCRCKALKLLDDAGRPYRLICKLTDIDQQKRSEKILLHKAQRDSLTGLYNSMTTERMIKDYLSGEGSGLRHALMVIDLDDFKQVNDHWGHRTGDELLQAIARKFRSLVRHSDIVGRIGGDEFVVLLKNIKSPEEIINAADKLRNGISAIRLAGTDESYTPACSIGIGIYPDQGPNYSTVFRIADESLYYIKNHGKNGSRLYE